MDKQIHHCAGLTPDDVAYLKRIARGAPLTADISRADVLVCCLMAPDRALVALHVMPVSTPSLYPEEQTGRTFSQMEQPLIFRALTSGSGGRRQREIIRHGAPVFQDVFPIHHEDADGPHRGGDDDSGRVIAAMVVETSMIAHERQKRRNRDFRRAVVWLQEMSVRGVLEDADQLSRFGQYDGVYLVNHHRTIRYMSGIASNLFRTTGVVIDAVGEQLSILEAEDARLVERAFANGRCAEARAESPDGRVWVRKAVPIRAPTANWLHRWLARPWYGAPRAPQSGAVHAVLVMVHNATEAVQKQRELNVKSAIIQEVHHRVKNNLQNIAAILRMQARRATNEEIRRPLLDAVNRVLSMAVIHEFMSHDEHRAINLRDVCQRIASQVMDIASQPDREVHIQVQGPNLRLPASQATPAALMVNELVLNAVEHGVGSRSCGRVDIILNDLGDAIEVTVADDGLGLPPDFDPLLHGSLGLQIVHTLATDDLKGTIRLTSLALTATAGVIDAPMVDANDNAVAGNVGTRAVVTFPKRPLGVD